MLKKVVGEMGSDYKNSIFDENGDLLPVKPIFLTKQKDKICAKNVILANYINNIEGIPIEIKKDILNKIDSIYLSGKKMHRKLREYKYGKK